MAAHGARRLMAMVDNLGRIVGIELVCAAQGVAFRAPLATSAPLRAVVARLREDVAPLGADRYLAPDLERAAGLIRSGAAVAASGVAFPALGAAS